MFSLSCIINVECKKSIVTPTFALAHTYRSGTKSIGDEKKISQNRATSSGRQRLVRAISLEIKCSLSIETLKFVVLFPSTFSETRRSLEIFSHPVAREKEFSVNW
jgi:hypothetical protein